MKKSNKVQASVLSGILVAAIALPFVFAQSATDKGNQQKPQFGRYHRGHGRERAGLWLSRLNLTDTQKSQMKQLRESFHDSTKPLRAELRAKMQEVHQANQGGTFNEALVTEKLTQTAALRAKLMGAQFKMRQEMLALLTPEQKRELEQMREQFKTKREQRRANRAERQST